MSKVSLEEWKNVDISYQKVYNANGDSKKDKLEFTEADRMNAFVEMLIFQVKPNKVDDFEAFLETMKHEMAQQEGCLSVRCFKRFYTFDGVEYYQPPRELTKVVKCVKYYAYWEFDSIESSGKAQGWFFENPARQVGKYLIMPFDINSGYSM